MKREEGLEDVSRGCALYQERQKESKGRVLSVKTERKGWIQLLSGC